MGLKSLTAVSSLFNNKVYFFTFVLTSSLTSKKWVGFVPRVNWYRFLHIHVLFEVNAVSFISSVLFISVEYFCHAN